MKNTVGPIYFDTVMMGIYLFLMTRYHLYLCLLGVTSILIHMGVAMLISYRRVNITRVQLRNESQLESYALNGIHMIETIKAGGAEDGFFDKWSEYQGAVYRSRSRLIRTDILLGTIPEFLEILAGDLVLVAGIWLVIRGRFAVGMIMSFQEIMELFMRPTTSTINAAQTIREMETQIERVEDVMNYPEDERVTGQTETVSISGKLKGHIVFSHITFGYSLHGKPLLSDLCLEIHPGERIAIVGETGCGKSTIVNLITGLYRPWEGEILYDGYQLDEIDRHTFTGSVAVVDQDVVLFEDTISNNIRMWDDTIEDFEVILAARDAGLHDEILLREGGYQNRLSEGGMDLSGGERQRLEIARVLAQDPTVLILDEATSALDAQTEQEVVKSICDRGITCIVIAHRLSTVRDCDRIFCMKHGRIVEAGTHEELCEKDGIYRSLVTEA